MEQLLLAEVQYPHPGDPDILGTGLFTYKTLKRLSKSELLEDVKLPWNKSRKHPPKVHLNIPDSLIFGFGFKSPTLMYTNEHGELTFCKGIEHWQFKIIVNIFKHLNERGKRPKGVSPLMIYKSDQGGYRRVFIRKVEAFDEWRSREKQPLDCIMQRFIRPKGRQTCRLRVISVPQGFKAVVLSNRTRVDGKAAVDLSPAKEVRHSAETSGWQEGETGLPTGSDIHAQARFYQKVIEKRVEESIQRFTAPAQPAKRKTRLGSTSHLSFEADDSDLSAYFESELVPVGLPSLPQSQLYAQLTRKPPKDAEDFEQNTMPLPSHLVRLLRERFCTDSTDTKKTSPLNIKTGKLIKPALMQTNLLRILVNRMIQRRRLRLVDLVCDFCEDWEGTWWLIKIKAYTVEEMPEVPVHIKLDTAFKCPGDYCNISVPPDEHYSFIGRDGVKFLYNGEMSELHHKHTTMLCELSKKTIMMDKILKSGDTTELGDLLNPRLLERIRVCYNCFHIYKDKERAFFNAELSLLKRSRKERSEKNKTLKLLSDVNDELNRSGKAEAILKPRIYSAHSQTLLLLERRIPDTSQHMREMGKQVTSMLKKERERSRSYYTLHQPAPAPLKKTLPAVPSENSFKTAFKDISRLTIPQEALFAEDTSQAENSEERTN